MASLKIDSESQWYYGDLGGSLMNPNVVVIHTTEGVNWPGYDGGKMAPNYTWWPGKGIRQHFPANRSSRALQNLRGGVETNTLNVIQVEIIGTCNPDNRGKAGWIYVPDLKAADLEDLGILFGDLHDRFPNLPLTHNVRWLPYPKSYGSKNGQRMSFAKWNGYRGFCGHQHVPENDHGDPGNFPIDTVLAIARGEVQPPAPKPPIPNKPTDPTKNDPNKKELSVATLADLRKVVQDEIRKATPGIVDQVWREQIPTNLTPEEKSKLGYGSDAYQAQSFQKSPDIRLRRLEAIVRAIAEKTGVDPELLKGL